MSAETVNPRGLPQPLAAVCGALAVLGAAAFLAGLAVDAPTAWGAFHTNFLFYAGLAQGGVVIAAIFVIVGAQWPGPVRRIAEGLGAWVPLSFVLLLGSFAGRRALFPWIEHPIEAKAAWLNVPRLFLTDFAILLALAGLSVAFLYYSLRPALHGAAERAPARTRALFRRWTAGWRGEEAELARSQRVLSRLAPIICLLFALGYTVIAFDQVMSMSPMWFSNLFGAYFAWGGFLSAVAVTALAAVLHGRSPDLGDAIQRSHLHDLGKMIFAFSIFWMYLFFSQYLVIWYGNLPEETGFVQQRLGSQFLQATWYFVLDRLSEPYAWLSMAVWACCWIIPFWVLLGQRPKKTRFILGPVAAIVAVGFWLERNVLVWPSMRPEDGMAWAGWIQLGTAAGFLGAFVLVYLVFTSVFPSLPVPRRS